MYIFIQVATYIVVLCKLKYGLTQLYLTDSDPKHNLGELQQSIFDSTRSKGFLKLQYIP